MVGVRFPVEVIEAVDQVAKARDITRSDVIREAVGEAVSHRLRAKKR